LESKTKEGTSLQQGINGLEADIAKHAQDLKNIGVEYSAVESEHRSINNKLALCAKSVHELERMINDEETKLRKTERELRQKEDKISKKRNEISTKKNQVGNLMQQLSTKQKDLQVKQAEWMDNKHKHQQLSLEIVKVSIINTVT